MSNRDPFAEAKTPMTDEEVMSELRSESLLNVVRRALSAAHGRIEQSFMQRVTPTPIQARRIEFEEARKIIDLCLAKTEGTKP